MITSRFAFLIPRSADALTVWPFIFVRPHRAADTPLLQHELVHHAEQGVAQIVLASVLALLLGSPWWLLVGIAPVPVWFVPYLLWPHFRLMAEVRGYRRQIELGGISISDAANRICSEYDLNVSQDKVVEMLLA